MLTHRQTIEGDLVSFADLMTHLRDQLKKGQLGPVIEIASRTYVKRAKSINSGEVIQLLETMSAALLCRAQQQVGNSEAQFKRIASLQLAFETSICWYNNLLNQLEWQQPNRFHVLSTQQLQLDLATITWIPAVKRQIDEEKCLRHYMKSLCKLNLLLAVNLIKFHSAFAMDGFFELLDKIQDYSQAKHFPLQDLQIKVIKLYAVRCGRLSVNNIRYELPLEFIHHTYTHAERWSLRKRNRYFGLFKLYLALNLSLCKLNPYCLFELCAETLRLYRFVQRINQKQQMALQSAALESHQLESKELDEHLYLGNFILKSTMKANQSSSQTRRNHKIHARRKADSLLDLISETLAVMLSLHQSHREIQYVAYQYFKIGQPSQKPSHFYQGVKQAKSIHQPEPIHHKKTIPIQICPNKRACESISKYRNPKFEPTKQQIIEFKLTPEVLVWSPKLDFSSSSDEQMRYRFQQKRRDHIQQFTKRLNASRTNNSIKASKDHTIQSSSQQHHIKLQDGGKRDQQRLKRAMDILRLRSKTSTNIGVDIDQLVAIPTSTILSGQPNNPKKITKNERISSKSKKGGRKFLDCLMEESDEGSNGEQNSQAGQRWISVENFRQSPFELALRCKTKRSPLKLRRNPSGLNLQRETNELKT